MNTPFEARKRRVEENIAGAVRRELTKEQEDALFVLADYDETAAEKTGYSNYSYWRSTINAFFHNRMAVFMLIVLALLTGFTFVQPLLPGQYDPNKINNNPVTGIQLQNQSPGLTTVYDVVPDGYRLIGQRLDDDWYAVSNVILTIKARDGFPVTEYLDTWCRIEYKGREG